MKRVEKSASLKKPKSHYRHGDLKNVIVTLAMKLIDEKGEVDFTIREIAALAGVTHTAAYRHFQSKREILGEIAVIGYKKMQEEFDKVLSMKGTSEYSTFVLLGVAYIDFAIENPTLFKVMFHQELKDCAANEILKISGPKAYQTLVNVIQENIQHGNYNDLVLEEMSLTAWSLVHGAATLYLNGMLSQGAVMSKKDMKTHALNICLHLESGFQK